MDTSIFLIICLGSIAITCGLTYLVIVEATREIRKSVQIQARAVMLKLREEGYSEDDLLKLSFVPHEEFMRWLWTRNKAK